MLGERLLRNGRGVQNVGCEREGTGKLGGGAGGALEECRERGG